MRIKITEIASHLLMWLILIGLFLPLVWMIATSLKTPEQIFAGNLNPLPWPATFANYTNVVSSLPFFRYTWNTFFIAALVTTGKLVTSLLAAYGFTQFKFRFRDTLFYVCLLTVFVPFTVTMMPNYLLMSKMGWLNTYAGAILPNLVDGLGIFWMRQSIRGVPASLMEAARLDGIGHVKILVRIIMPAIRPSLVALGILFFINSWNEYFWPLLILTDKSMYTLPVALQAFTNLEGGTDWGLMMAAASLTSLPPLLAYLVTQKQVVDTFVQSGIKG